MKNTVSIVTAFALLILFFIQLAGTLVESVYIQDLMNLKLDEKALGLLFFFAPILLFPLFKRYARPLAWVLCAVLLIARGLLPSLNTSDRLLAAGLGAAAAAALLFLLLTKKPGGANASQLALWGAAGLGLAMTFAVFLRAIGHGLEYSLMPAGAWLGWGLGLMLLAAILSLDWGTTIPLERSEKSVTGAIMGIILVLTLVWFSFSAPSVIARWTEGNYTLIVGLISLLSAVTAWICIARPHWLDRVNSGLLLIWNILFTLSLTGTILAQRVAYPATPDSPPIVVTSPGVIGQLTLVLTLVLFPVLFLDLRAFITRIAQASPAPRDLVPGFLLGMSFLVIMVFVNIFSNVWGYVPPVSPWFRGTFWLAFFLLASAITLLTWLVREPVSRATPILEKSNALGWGLVLGAMFLGTLIGVLPGERVKVDSANRTSLLVMTYNIQDANDKNAEKSYDRQLALMRKVSPDIISLQESDLTRISLNNNDYVRYYADQLGYYSYFGPKTVTGTYGTALLSKYPLENTHTIFTYSDEDEIGTTQAEIEVSGRRITIYDVHPAGSASAKMAFARMLVEQARDHPYMIALGDYNLRDHEDAYQLIDSVYTNTWTSVYPTEISPDGVDMSGDNRIDHIFISPALHARNPIYLLPPDSATDHPVHWAEIYWENP